MLTKHEYQAHGREERREKEAIGCVFVINLLLLLYVVSTPRHQGSVLREMDTDTENNRYDDCEAARGGGEVEWSTKQKQKMYRERMTKTEEGIAPPREQVEFFMLLVLIHRSRVDLLALFFSPTDNKQTLFLFFFFSFFSM